MYDNEGAIGMTLDDYVGKRIDAICESTLADNHVAYHCAHFVSHAMGYNVNKVSCKNLYWADTQNDKVLGATMRVNYLFNASARKGYWSKKPPETNAGCLIYACTAGGLSVNKNGVIKMLDVGQKHVGIFKNGFVWHYGNTDDKVYKDPLALFFTKFKRYKNERYLWSMMYNHNDVAMRK